MGYKSHSRNIKAQLSRTELKALETAGVIIENEAIERSSVGQYKNKVGGQYKTSWGHEVSETNKSVAIGNSTNYAQFVEYGTGQRGKESWQGELPNGYQHGIVPGMKAQRTLTGSMEDNLENIKNILKQELGDL